MNIHQRKAHVLIARYRNGELSAGKTEKISAKQNLVEHYKSIREQVDSDDNNKAFDSDSRSGFVTYSAGDRIGYSYQLTDNGMVETNQSIGYASVDEYSFSESGAERVSASHDVTTTGAAAGRLTVDKISPDGRSLSRESWWVDVNPLYKDIFVPNIDT